LTGRSQKTLTYSKRGLLIVVILLLPIVYLALGMTGTLTSALRGTAAIVPMWFALVNLLLAPALFAAVGLQALPIGVLQRGVLLLLALCSFSIAVLAYATHPLAFLAMLAALFAEAYWLVPLMNRVTERKSSPEGGAKKD
jgi:hypothetical protein